jgi:hypothetical protein
LCFLRCSAWLSMPQLGWRRGQEKCFYVHPLTRRRAIIYYRVLTLPVLGESARIPEHATLPLRSCTKSAIVLQRESAERVSTKHATITILVNAPTS